MQGGGAEDGDLGGLRWVVLGVRGEERAWVWFGGGGIWDGAISSVRVGFNGGLLSWIDVVQLGYGGVAWCGC